MASLSVSPFVRVQYSWSASSTPDSKPTRGSKPGKRVEVSVVVPNILGKPAVCSISISQASPFLSIFYLNKVRS